MGAAAGAGRGILAGAGMGARPAVMPRGFGQQPTMPTGPSQGQMQQMQGLRSALDARKNAFIQQNGMPTDAASQERMRSFMEGLPEMSQVRSLERSMQQGGMGAQPAVMPQQPQQPSVFQQSAASLG